MNSQKVSNGFGFIFLCYDGPELASKKPNLIGVSAELAIQRKWIPTFWNGIEGK
jgi:hypothetical protein